MRFLNLFKSSNTHKRDNKENNDPQTGNPNPDENGHRKSRQVNFQQSSGRQGDSNGRRRSCITDLEEDGASEVTLTATEANRPQHQFAPPNPYSIITEPKRNRGPRSCPGGHVQSQYFAFNNSLENDSSESATNLVGGQGHPNVDHQRMDDAHSTFIPNNQHRRSSRRRIVGGTVIGVVGGSEDRREQQFHHQRKIPFSEIGNAGRRNRHWDGVGGEESFNSRITPSSYTHYKNLPLVNQIGGGGQGQFHTRMREQQKELTELGFAYREERARRKALQRDLRREQQNRERLTVENFRLQSVIGLLLRQQPQNSASAAPNVVGVDLNTLFGAVGICPSFSWTANANTPSSSSAVGPLPPWATPSFAPPLVGGGILQHQNGGISSLTGGPGECLAQPLISSSSLLNGADGRPGSIDRDEVKVFRNGQHTDSFSGGSSRPTTDELLEGIISSEQSSRGQDNFSSPEIGRSTGGKQNYGNGTFCLSFSTDDFRQRELAKSSKLSEDSNLEQRGGQSIREDDGYATSETNISASICTTSLAHGIAMENGGGFGMLNGEEINKGKTMNMKTTTQFPAIRSMSAETI